MKKILYLFIFTIPILASTCNKGNPDSDTSYGWPNFNALPPITTTGENTFGCKVNGEIWVPNINYQLLADLMDVSFHVPTGSFNINVRKRIEEENIFQFFNISSWEIYQEGTNYTPIVTYRDRDTSFCSYTWFELDSTRDYSLEILKLDTENRIFSGTFYFTVDNAECDPIEITDGRFDVTF